MNLTNDDKIREVDGLLEDYRWARAAPATQEHRTWLALKAIAVELRARQPEVPGQVEAALERRRATVIASKEENRYDAGHLIGLAEELLGRWPVVVQALRLLTKFEVIDRTQEGLDRYRWAFRRVAGDWSADNRARLYWAAGEDVDWTLSEERTAEFEQRFQASREIPRKVAT